MPLAALVVLVPAGAFALPLPAAPAVPSALVTVADAVATPAPNPRRSRAASEGGVPVNAYAASRDRLDELFALAEQGGAQDALRSFAAHHGVRAGEKAEPIVRQRETRSAFADAGRLASDLKGALDALRDNRYEEALARRNGLTDRLDRTIVDYFLSRSGARAVSAEMIAEYGRAAQGWPTPDTIRAKAEIAFGRGNADPQTIVNTFREPPVTAEGVRTLAKAHAALGNTADTERLVREAWRTRTMGAALQRAFLADFSEILTADDHLDRVDMLVARDRFEGAKALRARLRENGRAYVDARIAAASGNTGAARLLADVPKALRDREGYRLAQVELARCEDEIARAQSLLAKAPTPTANGDAWWVETRILARHLLEDGKPGEAYALVSQELAESARMRADEAFHAGWLALLADKADAAATHFARLDTIATTPITKARAAYWQARAALSQGNATAARTHYERAAAFGFTYYGQLSREALGRSGTGLGRVPTATPSDRTAFANNELAEAVRRLVRAGHQHRIRPFVMALAKTVPTPGQVVLTVELAEAANAPHLSLAVAKAGQRRGLAVARLPYPTAAIPKSATMPAGLDRALVYAIARQESEFNAGAVSPAGARGLMQVMPRTGASLARELKLRHSTRRLTSDPAYNATLGAAYLDKRLADFDGSYVLTFAAYNAGAGRVREWIERFGDPREPSVDVIEWIEQIPFPETRNYVQRILENVQVYREALGTGRLAIGADLVRGRPS